MATPEQSTTNAPRDAVAVLTLSRHELSAKQLRQLRDLVERAGQIDVKVGLLNEAGEEARNHHQALLAGPADKDAIDNADRMLRVARSEAARAAMGLDPLFKEANEKGMAEVFQDIRTLTDVAPRDALAAAELARVYAVLNLELPRALRATQHEINGIEEDIGQEFENSIELDDPERQSSVPALPENEQPVEQSEPSQSDDRVEEPSGFEGFDRKKDPRAVPAHIVTAFHRKGDRYLDSEDRQTLVFQDKGTALVTVRNFEMRSVRAMIDVAQERGWPKIKLTGSPEFRRAGWFEAVSRGMEASGYTPTEAEKAAAAKAAQANASHENSVSKEQKQKAAQQAQGKTSATPVSSGEATNKPAPAAQGASQRTESKPNPVTQRGGQAKAVGEPPTGRLIEHGPDHFEHDKNNTMSYYLKVATAKGDKTYWGVDFPRALEADGAKVGQQVIIKNEGKRMVTVSEPVKDDKGAVVGYQDIETERNTWSVKPFENEQVKAFKQATTPEAKAEAAKANPNLANAFAHEAALRRFASERLQPKDAELFMAEQRRLIEKDLADGIAFKSVNVRDQSKGRQPRERVAEQGQER